MGWRFSEKIEYIGKDPRDYLVIFLEDIVPITGKKCIVIKTSLGDHVYRSDTWTIRKLDDIMTKASELKLKQGGFGKDFLYNLFEILNKKKI